MNVLSHWGWVMRIYASVNWLTIIGSDNGLLTSQCQAIIWTNAGILLIIPVRINFSEISIKISTFSFRKMHLKMLSGKWQPFCLGLNMLFLAALNRILVDLYCEMIQNVMHVEWVRLIRKCILSQNLMAYNFRLHRIIDRYYIGLLMNISTTETIGRVFRKMKILDWFKKKFST